MFYYIRGAQFKEYSCCPVFRVSLLTMFCAVDNKDNENRWFAVTVDLTYRLTRSRQIQNQNRSQLSTHHSSCDVYKGQQTEKGRFSQNRFRVKATAEFNLTLNQ